MSGLSVISKVIKTYQELFLINAKLFLQDRRFESSSWSEFLYQQQKQFLMPSLVAVIKKHPINPQDWTKVASEYQAMMANVLFEISKEGAGARILSTNAMLVIDYLIFQREGRMMNAICQSIAAKIDIRDAFDSYTIPWPVAISAPDFESLKKDDLERCLLHFGRDKAHVTQHQFMIERLLALYLKMTPTADELRGLWHLFADKPQALLPKREGIGRVLSAYFGALIESGQFDAGAVAKEIVSAHLYLLNSWARDTENTLYVLNAQMSDDDRATMLIEYIEHLTANNIILLSEDDLDSLLQFFIGAEWRASADNVVALLNCVRHSPAHSQRLIANLKPLLTQLVSDQHYKDLITIIRDTENSHVIADIVNVIESKKEALSELAFFKALLSDPHFSHEVTVRIIRRQGLWASIISHRLSTLDDSSRDSVLQEMDVTLAQRLMLEPQFVAAVTGKHVQTTMIMIKRDFNETFTQQAVKETSIALTDLLDLLATNTLIKKRSLYAQLLIKLKAHIQEGVADDKLDDLSQFIREYGRHHDLGEAFQSVLRIVADVYKSPAALLSLFGLKEGDAPTLGNHKFLIKDLFKQKTLVQSVSNFLNELSDDDLVVALGSMTKEAVSAVATANSNLRNRFYETHHEALAATVISLDIERRLTLHLLSEDRVKAETHFLPLLKQYAQEPELFGILCLHTESRIFELSDADIIKLATEYKLAPLLPLIARRVRGTIMIEKIFSAKTIQASPSHYADAFEYLVENSLIAQGVKKYLDPAILIDLYSEKRFPVNYVYEYVFDSAYPLSKLECKQTEYLGALAKRYMGDHAFTNFILYGSGELKSSVTADIFKQCLIQVLHHTSEQQLGALQPGWLVDLASSDKLSDTDWFEIINDSEFKDETLKSLILSARLRKNLIHGRETKCLKTFAGHLNEGALILLHVFLVKASQSVPADDDIYAEYLKNAFLQPEACLALLARDDLSQEVLAHFTHQYFKKIGCRHDVICKLIEAFPALEATKACALLEVYKSNPNSVLERVSQVVQVDNQQRVTDTILVCFGLLAPPTRMNPNLREALFSLLPLNGEGILSADSLSKIRQKIIINQTDVVKLCQFSPDVDAKELAGHLKQCEPSILKTIITSPGVSQRNCALALKYLLPLEDNDDIEPVRAFLEDPLLEPVNGEKQAELSRCISFALAYVPTAQESDLHFHHTRTQALSLDEYSSAKKLLHTLASFNVDMTVPQFCYPYNHEFYVSKSWYTLVQRLQTLYDAAIDSARSEGQLFVNQHVFDPVTKRPTLFLLNHKVLAEMKAVTQPEAETPDVVRQNSWLSWA